MSLETQFKNHRKSSNCESAVGADSTGTTTTSPFRLVRRARIPLEHVDHVSSSMKHLNKMRVTLRADQCRAFELGTGFPTQIVAITSKYK